MYYLPIWYSTWKLIFSLDSKIEKKKGDGGHFPYCTEWKEKNTPRKTFCWKITRAAMIKLKVGKVCNLHEESNLESCPLAPGFLSLWIMLINIIYIDCFLNVECWPLDYKDYKKKEQIKLIYLLRKNFVLNVYCSSSNKITLLLSHH